jgi:excisionase family DNA binding protein
MARDRNEQPVEQFIPLDEVAKRLGYKAVKTVRRLIDRGELPKPLKCGGRLCLVKTELDRYMHQRMSWRHEEVKRFRQQRRERHRMPAQPQTEGVEA